jgi:glycosyltransferase involved in cell wall biosynthesis
MAAIEIIILSLAGLTAGTIGVYPAAAWLRAKIRPRPVHPKPWPGGPVSILIAVQNEEGPVIERLNALRAPSDWIPGSEILVGTGGSTDRTVQVLREYAAAHPEVRVFDSEEKWTKNQALARIVPEALHDVFVFSDCRQEVRPGSVPALLAYLHNDEVGTVTSVLDDGARGLRALLVRIAQWDSTADSCLNIYGALYAQRRVVYRPVPPELMMDDLFAVVATLGQGKRIIQAPAARILDLPFDRYYNRERLARLSRGLWLFVRYGRNWISDTPWRNRWRFVVFKMGKLALPWAYLAGASVMLELGLRLQPRFTLLVLAVLAIAALLLPSLRRALLQFHLIMWVFVSETWAFWIRGKRSKSWAPLPTQDGSRRR